VVSSGVVGTAETYQSSLDEKTKAELARNRRTQIDDIRKGDYMMSKHNPQEALGYYLPVLEKIPDDVVLEKKIAMAYFLLKDWKNAYMHFIRVPLSELSQEEQTSTLLSLFYDESAPNRGVEIAKLPLSDTDKEYYSVMNACYAGAEACVGKISAYTGADSRISDLGKNLEDAKKISTEVNYRDFLLATKLYEQKMYRLSAMVASEVLARAPNYHQVQKLRGFSLYELGRYSDARDILVNYLESSPEDLEVIVRLGEVFALLGDYTTANLYLNNAIMAGYTPKTTIERRLAYNYAKIGDKEGMKKVLSYLLQESDVKEDDFAVAISLAISQSEYIRAYSWAHEGLEVFPSSKTLIPLYVQSLRLVGKLQEASEYIASLPSDTQELPLLQLEKAILLYQQGHIGEAKRIFSALVEFDQVADFSLEAERYLAIIGQIEKSHESSTSGEESSSWSLTGEAFWDS